MNKIPKDITGDEPIGPVLVAEEEIPPEFRDRTQPETDTQPTSDDSGGPDLAQNGPQDDFDPLEGPPEGPEPKKGRGRPPGASNKGPRHFPAPAIFNYASDHPKTNCQPEAFIKYWQRLYADPEFRERLLVYVYRTYPVIDREKVIDPKTNKPTKHKAIDGPVAQVPEKLSDIYHWYGSGDYKFYLADGAHRPSKQICRCFLTGIRDFDTFAPVLDIEDLVLDDPKNKSYIDWRKRNGHPVPGQETDEEKKRKAEEMASNETVSQLADTNKYLMDKVIDLAEKSAEHHHPKDEQKRPQIHDFSSQVMQEASSAAITLIKDGAAQAINMRAAAEDRHQDPIGNVSRVLHLVKELVPPAPAPDNTILQIVQDQNRRLAEQLDKMNADRVAHLEAELVRLKESPKETAVVVKAPKTLTDQMRELAEFKKTMADLLGDGDEEGGKKEKSTEKQEWWEKLLPMALPLGIYAIGAISNMLHNQAVVAAGKGTPEAPPPPPPVDPSTLPPEARVALQQQQRAQAQQTQQQEAAKGGAEVNPVKMLVGLIERPLLNHINRGANGHEFAGWFIDGQGLDVYGQVKSFGKDALVQALSTYSPGVLQAMGAMGEGAADKFLDQFMAGPEDPDAEGDD